MKAHSLKLLAFVAIALCVVAATAFHPIALGVGDSYVHASALTAVALATLRAEHADLLTRATAKRAEIKDGMSADQIRAIDEAHAALVTEAESKKREIEVAEAAERAKPPAEHSWTRSDIQKINARAVGFGLGAAVAAEIMADDKIRSVEEATDALQERAVAARPGERQVPHARIVRDEGDTLREAVGTAILLRANPQALPQDDKRREMAREWRGMSLLEAGRAFLEQVHGKSLRGLSRMELATVCLGLDTLGRSAGMLSTSDFANVLANVANKRLRDAYAQAPSYWKMLGRQSNNSDFKTKSVVQLSSAPTFKKVREGQEYSYGGMTDGAESYALATYGRIVAITRQALINDDLGAFDRIPMMLGRQAAELEASTFWAILTANAALSDGTALFHADHGNLAGSGTVIDTTNLGLARAAMRKQKTLAAKAADREPMNLVPKFLVVSPDKETEAQQALTAVLAAQSDKVNIFASSLTPVVEARLTGNTWYLFADPATIDTIEYSYLEGEEGLYTEQRIGFEVDGIEIKGRVDFAAKAIDFRGMYKNPGA